MEIRTVRKPGDKGTQALMRKYGERLIPGFSGTIQC